MKSHRMIVEHHEHINEQCHDDGNIILNGATDKTSKVESICSHQVSIGDEGNDPEKTEKTSIAGWVLVAVVVMISSSSAMMWTTGSAIPTVTQNYFNITLSQVNWLSNASAIINTIFSLPSAWIYERFGIKFSIILAATLNMIGCWIRCIAILVPQNKKYAMMMLGQFVASFGGPLVYNIAAKLTAVWFASKDRAIANMLISIQLGMVLSPLVLPQIAKEQDAIPRVLLILAGIATAVTVPTFFLPSQPKRPPSNSALTVRMSFTEGLKQLMKNSTFLWMVLLASVNMGAAFAVSVLIIEALLPFGYSDTDSGICAAVIVIGGYAGGLMAGYWAGKTEQYLMLIKMFAPIIVFSYVIFIFQIIPNAFGAVIIACIINGFFGFGIFPVMLEFTSEVTYPVPESISSCVIWTTVTVAMLIFSVMIDALRAGPDANPPNNMTDSMIAMAAVVAVGFIPAFWLKGDLKRLAVDMSKKPLNEANEEKNISTSQV